jgi:conjugal transfer pilus assembly protein TraF
VFIKLLIVWFLSVSSLVCASSALYTDESERGLFWGELPEAEIEEEEFSKPIIPNPSEMMKMHPQQLDKLRQQALEYAVYTQSEEDTAKYWQIIDVVRRKADGFVGVSGYVKMKNPNLSGNMAFPVNNPGRKTKLKDERQEVNSELRKSNKEYALIMFTQKGCSACVVQRQILGNFNSQTGWRIKEIDINENPIAQARFGINGTPITVLISRKRKDDWLPVAIGTDSLSNVKSNIVRAVKIIEGTNTPQQWYMTEGQRGQFFDPKAYDEQGVK